MSSFPQHQLPETPAHPELQAGHGPSSRGIPPPVPQDGAAETSEPTIKRRKRADARQLEALKRMYARTAFPSTEERQQLARDLGMSARSVQVWWAHAFVHVTCIISEISTILSGSRTKGKRALQAGSTLRLGRQEKVTRMTRVHFLTRSKVEIVGKGGKGARTLYVCGVPFGMHRMNAC
jgi:hypothetical protein